MEKLLTTKDKNGTLALKKEEILTISATKDDGYSCEIELQNGDIYYSLEEPEDVIRNYYG